MSDNTTPDPASLTAGRVPVLSIDQIRAWHASTSSSRVDPDSSPRPPVSLEVSFSAALDHLYPVVIRAERQGQLPPIGSPAWRDLPDGDPRKVGAIYYAALIHALHVENRQTCTDEAAEHISASGLASRAHQYRCDIDNFYNEHPDLKRRAS